MKKTVLLLLLCLALALPGCRPEAGASPEAGADLAATTLPVYEFTLRLCQGSGLSVARLVTENVSCLHDYSLQVAQMRSIAAARAVILSGAGLELFLEDALDSASAVIDASQGIPLLEGEDSEAEGAGGDPHIWLSPENARRMAANVCGGLCSLYPEKAALFQENLAGLDADLAALQQYGEEALSQLSCRELVTFHDGFAYFAQAFHLTILEAVEEESGSEASAAALVELIRTVEAHELPAVFTEVNGSTAAAEIISRETGVPILPLDMAIGGASYFDAMYHNIDTLREAYT